MLRGGAFHHDRIFRMLTIRRLDADAIGELWFRVSPHALGSGPVDYFDDPAYGPLPTVLRRSAVAPGTGQARARILFRGAPSRPTAGVSA